MSRVMSEKLGRVKKKNGELWVVDLPPGLFEDNEMGPYANMEDLASDRSGIARFLVLHAADCKAMDRRTVQAAVQPLMDRRHVHRPVRRKTG